MPSTLVTARRPWGQRPRAGVRPLIGGSDGRRARISLNIDTAVRCDAFAMARRHYRLRAAHVHDDMMNAPAVASDSNIAMMAETGTREIDGPDAKIGANVFLDVIPDTPVSRWAHMGRSGIDHQDQLITYAPKTEAFLRSICDAEDTPNAADSD
jgi:hypothetical protein